MFQQGQIFSDFGSQSDFLEQIGLRKVRFWAQKSDFKSFRQHQLHFSTVLVQNGGTAECISESVHISSSKLILAGINTNYMAQSRGAQLCLSLDLKPHLAMVWFLSLFVTLGSYFGLISKKIMVRFRSDFGQWWSYFIFGNTAPGYFGLFLNLGKKLFLKAPPSTGIGRNSKCRLFWYLCSPSDPC